MNEQLPPYDRFGEDVVVFVAVGLVCRRLDLSLNKAMVVMAKMAVTRGQDVVDVAWAIVAGVIDPGSSTATPLSS